MKFTIAGILFMVVAWGVVISLVLYTYTKVLKQKKKD